MAFSEQTPGLGLPQWMGADKLEREDFNGSFLILDKAIDGKQATLVSGTNIRTVNGTTLLGSGNITVGGGSGTSPVERVIGFTADCHVRLTPGENHSEAIQVEINRVAGAGGGAGSRGKLILRAGRYIIDSPINMHTIVMEGEGNSTILDFTNLTGNQSVFQDNYVGEGVAIFKNMSLESETDYPTSSTGKIRSVRRTLIIDNVNIRGGGSGIQIGQTTQSPHNNVITNCTIDVPTNGISISANNEINNNIIANNKINCTNVPINIKGNDNLITGNICGEASGSYSAAGIICIGNNNRISDNLLIWCSSTTARGNVALGSATATDPYSYNNTVSGNVVLRGNTGISLNRAERNTIVGNSLYNGNQHAIYLNFSSQNTIVGNYCESYNGTGIYSTNSVMLTICSNTVLYSATNINVSGGNTHMISGNNVLAYSYDSTQYSIRIGAGVTDSFVTGNNIIGKAVTNSSGNTTNTILNNKHLNTAQGW